MKYQLKAKEEYYYDGKTRKVGEVFEATDPDATILVVTNKAENVTPPPRKAKAATPPPPADNTYPTKVVTNPEDINYSSEKSPVTPAGEPETGPARRRRYLRRDMKAED